MRTFKFMAAAFTLLLTVSCNSNKQQNIDPEPDIPGGVAETIVDTVRLITLKDNEGMKSMPNKLFYGERDSAKVERLSPDGSVPSSICCFLVKARGKNVLFDTGVGEDKGGMLMKRLKSINVAPSDIDYVVITHFHGDHIGGLTRDGKPVFTNAELYVPEQEYDGWRKMDGQRAKNAIETVDSYGDRLHIFAYGEPLPFGIKALPAPGHTPGHTVYRIGNVLIGGDLMHGVALQTQDLTICPDYDMNRQKAIESRMKYMKYVKQNNLTLVGMHFPLV